MAPPTATKAKQAPADEAPTEDARPPSKLMRVPLETYEQVQKWAETHRRAMNQQLAVIVDEWTKAERARQAREEAKEAKRSA